MSVKVTVDFGNLRTGIVPEVSALRIIAIQGLPVSTVILNEMCFVFYYTQENIYISFVLLCDYKKETFQ